jgi:hypothetical protein
MFRKRYARQHRIAVSGLQKPQLRDRQEQEENDTAAGIQKVLPFLSQTHGAQGNQIGF